MQPTSLSVDRATYCTFYTTHTPLFPPPPGTRPTHLRVPPSKNFSAVNTLLPAWDLGDSVCWLAKTGPINRRASIPAPCERAPALALSCGLPRHKRHSPPADAPGGAGGLLHHRAAANLTSHPCCSKNSQRGHEAHYNIPQPCWQGVVRACHQIKYPACTATEKQFCSSLPDLAG